MSDIKWRSSTRSGNASGVDILTTELNSLANNAGSAPSTAVPNDTGNVDLDFYVDLELTVTFGSAPTDGFAVECYVVRQIDGSNYEDASSSGPIVPRNGFVGSFLVRNVTTAQRIIIPGVVLPPRDFKLMVVNKTGQAFPASGSKVRGYFYKEQVG
jgi:hypothetical protein